MRVTGGKGLGSMPEAATVAVFMSIQEARVLIGADRPARELQSLLLAEIQAEVEMVDRAAG